MDPKKKGQPIEIFRERCAGCLICQLRCSLRFEKAFNPSKARIRVLRLVGADSAVGEVVNIGNDAEITIEDLALLVKEKTQSSSPVQFIPYDEAYEPGFEDMARRVPSMEKLVRLAGFRPTTPLPVIIDKVVAYVAPKTRLVPTPQA